MAYDNNNQGALFQRENRGNGGPDFSGNIEIGPDLLQHLNNLARSGQPAVIEAAAWKRVSQTKNQPFLSIRVQVPYQQRQQPMVPQTNQQPRQQPIQTTRGPMQRAPVNAPQRPVQRPNTQNLPNLNQQFRQELNDELPEQWGPRPSEQMPWDN